MSRPLSGSPQRIGQPSGWSGCAGVVSWVIVADGVGEEVVIRRRLQLLDDVPAVLSTSYYPLWIADGTRLESPDALPEGPDEPIERLGHRFVHGIEVFRAEMPVPEEARLLQLRPGITVVHMWHVDYDEQDRPLQVAHDIYAADRHEFSYEWNEGDIRR
ncbi:UTRA domain-containing protein [Actinoplanes sp. NEAU-A12]|uniref:UTRA domain-containing protein n=1 Tax=Actinoplanes sandaracinus TaxID=3045177 RepID=A0ABT6WJB8_9ACTN|nr:UTRA domain-containing protein [Actinoplanes sandaracinus]MDI6099825.1 UTRA domain-containing protein [Actinoplanes sandaracinus]